jgi:Fe-S-cluster containining protein
MFLASRKPGILEGYMVTDLVQIRRLGEKQRRENGRFRAWLKRHNFVERRLKAIAEEVEAAMDCTACANCCRVATTQVSERDSELLARHLGMKLEQFLREYTVETAEEGRILRRTENGCIFLEANLCSVYEARPRTCALFPHLVKGNGSFESRMWHMPDRAVYCPIVFESLERFKSETGFKR